jgi:hypothetical protein
MLGASKGAAMDAGDADSGVVVGHIQTDTFCESCGYNLHTQAVRRDPRLEILVCRCPECGRWTAAGKSTARQVWLNRLGQGLLMFWIVSLLLAFGLLSLFLGMSNYGNMISRMTFEQTAPTPSNPYPRYHRVLAPPPVTEREISRRRYEDAMMAFLMGMLGLITGVLAALAFWHVHGWRRLVALLPPLLGFAGAWLTVIDDDDLETLRRWAMGRLGLGLLWECAAVLIGLYLGRPLARAALHILLPPRGRQHLAFLWTTDGRTLKLT